MARRALLDRGYVRVRPLLGGLEGWVVAGHAVDTHPDPERLAADASGNNTPTARAQAPRIAVTDADIARDASDLGPTSTH